MGESNAGGGADQNLQSDRDDQPTSDGLESWRTGPLPVYMKSSHVYFGILFGVLLPLLTLFVEMSTGMSAESYIDPIPSKLHLFLVAMVPAVNLLVMVIAAKGWVGWRRPLGILNGATLVVALAYGLVYLPMSPIAVVAILFFGIGFLPLSPVLSFFAVWRGHCWLRDLRPMDGSPRVPGVVLGAFLGLLLIVGAEVPAVVTRAGLQMAQSESSATRQRGIDLLRRFGSDARLLEACYGIQTSTIDGISRGELWGLDRVRGLSPNAVENARDIYYQVTGRAFNSEPVPSRARRRGWDVDPALGFMWDDALGSDQVAGRIPGLSLASSRMDGKIEPDAAVGYVEWTMVFSNRSAMEREARSILQLPAGGVVSRLTLWINDEEHEAAWGGGSQVRRAYQDVVVVQRRDPVLVTYAGEDRVMMQCFPVPSSGRMKIRVGVTFPLALSSADGAGDGTFNLPGFVERNFSVGDDVMHAVWLNSPRAMSIDESRISQQLPSEKKHELRAELKDSVVSATSTAIKATRSKGLVIAWTEDRPRSAKPNEAKPATRSLKVIPTSNSDSNSTSDRAAIPEAKPINTAEPMAIAQTFETEKVQMAKRLVLVIDGSASMADHADAIAASLEAFADDVDLRIIFAGDTPQWLDEMVGEKFFDRATAMDAIREFDYVGGRDNVRALAYAWDAAADTWWDSKAKDERAAVLWLHGPQPVILRDVDTLRQRLQRRPDGPAIYALQLANGPNHITRSLSSRQSFHLVPRIDDVESQLKTVAANWKGEQVTVQPIRSRVTLANVTDPSPTDVPVTYVHASQHLRRLWVLDRIQALIRADDPESKQEAAALGKSTQLVTPITGAVVLETKEQYERHGLKQSTGNSPGIPEPGTALLFLMMGGGALAATGRRRSRANRAAA